MLTGQHNIDQTNKHGPTAVTGVKPNSGFPHGGPSGEYRVIFFHTFYRPGISCQEIISKESIYQMQCAEH